MTRREALKTLTDKQRVMQAEDGRTYVIRDGSDYADLHHKLYEKGLLQAAPEQALLEAAGWRYGKTFISINDLRNAGGDFHKAYVTKALAEGKPVPAEVLASYPDLAPKYVSPVENTPQTRLRQGYEEGVRAAKGEGITPEDTVTADRSGIEQPQVETAADSVKLDEVAPDEGQTAAGKADTPPERAGKAVAKNPLPNMESAKVDPRKLTDYALNPEHPVGGNKTKVFESALGYNKSNADALMKQVQEKLPQSEAVLGKADQYGQRYTVDMQITGPNGNTATVRTGWMLKPGSTTPEMTKYM